MGSAVQDTFQRKTLKIEKSSPLNRFYGVITWDQIKRLQVVKDLIC